MTDDRDDSQDERPSKRSVREIRLEVKCGECGAVLRPARDIACDPDGVFRVRVCPCTKCELESMRTAVAEAAFSEENP